MKLIQINVFQEDLDRSLNLTRIFDDDYNYFKSRFKNQSLKIVLLMATLNRLIGWWNYKQYNFNWEAFWCTHNDCSITQVFMTEALRGRTFVLITTFLREHAYLSHVWIMQTRDLSLTCWNSLASLKGVCFKSHSIVFYCLKKIRMYEYYCYKR